MQGCHEGIVTEQTYNLVQTETARRVALKKNVVETAVIEKSKYSGRYAFSDLLICGDCGTMYRRKTWRSYDGSNRIVWCCLRRLENGKVGCSSPALDEYRVQSAVMDAIARHSKMEVDIDNIVLNNSKLAMSGAGNNPYALKSQITKLEQSLSQLIAISVKAENAKVFERRFKQLSDEIVEKKNELETLERTRKKDETLEQRIQLAQKVLQQQPLQNIPSYDNILVRLTIQRITVLDEDTLKLQFVDGTYTTVVMEPRK